MCTKYKYGQPRPEVVKFYADKILADSYEQCDKYSPTDLAPVITADEPNLIQMFHFGLLPHTAQDVSDQKYMNAKSETLLEKPTFRPLMIHHKRCLVISDGFYENKKDGKLRIPMHFFLKDRLALSYAGLWSRWRNPIDNSIYDSFTIITTEPNTLISPIHDRMPVILHKEDEDKWLNKKADINQLMKLCLPYPADLMQMEAAPLNLHKKKTAQLGFFGKQS